VAQGQDKSKIRDLSCIATVGRLWDGIYKDKRGGDTHARYGQQLAAAQTLQPTVYQHLFPVRMTQQIRVMHGVPCIHAAASLPTRMRQDF
jgi:hypothetical protein